MSPSELDASLRWIVGWFDDQSIREGRVMRSGPAGKKEIWWEEELDLVPTVWPSRRRWPARAWGWVGLMAACPALFAVAAGTMPRAARDMSAIGSNQDRRAVTVLTFLPGQVEIEVERSGRDGDIDPHVIILRGDDMDRRIIVQVDPDLDRRIAAELPELPELTTLPAIMPEGGGWLVLPPCRAG